MITDAKLKRAAAEPRRVFQWSDYREFVGGLMEYEGWVKAWGTPYMVRPPAGCKVYQRAVGQYQQYQTPGFEAQVRKFLTTTYKFSPVTLTPPYVATLPRRALVRGGWVTKAIEVPVVGVLTVAGSLPTHPVAFPAIFVAYLERSYDDISWHLASTPGRELLVGMTGGSPVGLCGSLDVGREGTQDAETGGDSYV